MAKLQNMYAGERARDKEQQVLAELHKLQDLTNSRKHELADINDLYRSFNMSRDLMMWMETQMRQMKNDD